jgi:hypothetical protein
VEKIDSESLGRMVSSHDVDKRVLTMVVVWVVWIGGKLGLCCDERRVKWSGTAA